MNATRAASFCHVWSRSGTCIVLSSLQVSFLLVGVGFNLHLLSVAVPYLKETGSCFTSSSSAFYSLTSLSSAFYTFYFLVICLLFYFFIFSSSAFCVFTSSSSACYFLISSSSACRFLKISPSSAFYSFTSSSSASCSSSLHLNYKDFRHSYAHTCMIIKVLSQGKHKQEEVGSVA